MLGSLDVVLLHAPRNAWLGSLLGYYTYGAAHEHHSHSHVPTMPSTWQTQASHRQPGIAVCAIWPEQHHPTYHHRPMVIPFPRSRRVLHERGFPCSLSSLLPARDESTAPHRQHALPPHGPFPGFLLPHYDLTYMARHHCTMCVAAIWPLKRTRVIMLSDSAPAYARTHMTLVPRCSRTHDSAIVPRYLLERHQ